MRHCVQQGRSKCLTFPGSLNLRGEVLCPRPFQSNRDEIGDSLENGVRQMSPMERKACNRLWAQTYRSNDALVLSIGKGCALQCRVAKLIVKAVKIQRTGTIKLVRGTLVEYGCAQLEDFRKLAGQLLRERFRVV